MENKYSSIDAAMLTKKYYCHKCGDRLVRNPRTRLIRRGDPDYKKYSRIGHGHFIGDIELTEYDFKCCNYDRIISPNEQYVIHKTQEMLGKYILSEEELLSIGKQARLAIVKRKQIVNIVVKAVFIVAILITIYFTIKTGDFSIKFYL